MQNFMFKCSKLASKLKKNHHLTEKQQKTDFDDFNVVKVSVFVTVLKWFFISLTIKNKNRQISTYYHKYNCSRKTLIPEFKFCSGTTTTTVQLDLFVE